jgi:hypothetical protein
VVAVSATNGDEQLHGADFWVPKSWTASQRRAAAALFSFSDAWLDSALRGKAAPGYRAPRLAVFTSRSSTTLRATAYVEGQNWRAAGEAPYATTATLQRLVGRTWRVVAAAPVNVYAGRGRATFSASVPAGSQIRVVTIDAAGRAVGSTPLKR